MDTCSSDFFVLLLAFQRGHTLSLFKFLRSLGIPVLSGVPSGTLPSPTPEFVLILLLLAFFFVLPPMFFRGADPRYNRVSMFCGVEGLWIPFLFLLHFF